MNAHRIVATLSVAGALLALAAAGCAKAPGTIVVTGTGADSYFVADEAGERDLTGFHRTGATIEMPPGRYVVVLNGSRASVRVRSAQRVEVVAGSLGASGSGSDSYYVADSAGGLDLTGHHRTGSPLEMFPGRYVVWLNGTRADATVSAGQRTEIAAGSLLVSGSGGENYFLADSAGVRDLTGFHRSGTPMELLPGRYVVRLGDRRLPIQIMPGEQTSAGP